MKKFLISILMLMLTETVNVYSQSKKQSLSVNEIRALQATVNYEWNYAPNRDTFRATISTALRLSGVTDLEEMFEVIQTISTNKKNRETIIDALKFSSQQYNINLSDLLMSWGMNIYYAKKIEDYSKLNLSLSKQETKREQINDKDIAEDLIQNRISLYENTETGNLIFENFPNVSFICDNKAYLFKKLNTYLPDGRIKLQFNADGSLSKIYDYWGKTETSTENDVTLKRSIRLDKPVILLVNNKRYFIPFTSARFVFNRETKKNDKIYIFRIEKNNIVKYSDNLEELKNPFITAKADLNFETDSIKATLLDYFKVKDFDALKKLIIGNKFNNFLDKASNIFYIEYSVSITKFTIGINDSQLKLREIIADQQTKENHISVAKYYKSDHNFSIIDNSN